MADYDAVVFDNDGVLVELTDGPVLTRAARDALAEHGIEDPPGEFVEALAYARPFEGLTGVADEHDVTPATLWEARERAAIERQRAAIEDGGKPLFDDVAALADLPYPLGVVSNNQQDTVDNIVERYDLGHLFEVTIGREPTVAGLERRKPETHYLDRALDALAADHALYVGDSPKDVEVAHRAGIDSAYIRRPHRDDRDPGRDPTYRVESLAELVDALVEGASP